MRSRPMRPERRSPAMTRPRPAAKARPVQRAADTPDDRSSRRRASRSLWSACEAMLAAAEPRMLSRALDQLAAAFDCDGVAMHIVGASGELEPWAARGTWRTAAGDLRGCLSVQLRRGSERVGTLDLLG